MLHSVFGRKLNRSANERKRLFRNLTRSLILHGKITTTLAKAKAIQPLIEKMITKAKNDNALKTRRLLLKSLSDRFTVDKLLEIGPLFKNRNGGYTRIVKLGRRVGDNANHVVMTFTETVASSVISKVEKIKDNNAKDKTNKTK